MQLEKTRYSSLLWLGTNGSKQQRIEKYERNRKIRGFSKRFLSALHLKLDGQDITSHAVAAADN